MRLLAILCCVLWGSAFAAATIGFEYMPPILLSGIRFIIAGSLLIVPLLVQRVRIIESTLKHWRFMLLFAFVQTFMQYGIFFLGLDRVPPDVASIIIGAGPLFIAVMAHYTMSGDRLTSRKVLSISLGMAGVILISVTGGSDVVQSPSFYFGVGCLVVSNVMGSYANIMVAKYTKELSPVLLTSFANISGGVMLLGVGFATEELPTTPPTMEFLGALLWLSTISALTFSVWYSLLKRPGVKVSELNMWKFLVPVSGSVLSWWLIPETEPTIMTITGIVIISLSLIIFQRK